MTKGVIDTEIARTERHGSITLKWEDSERCAQEREKKELQEEGPGEKIHKQGKIPG